MPCPYIDDMKLKIIIVAGVGVIALLTGYFVLFKPLIRKLKLLSQEYKSLEVSVSRSRDALNFSELKGFKKELVSEADVSLALDELTKETKVEGINLISLTAKQLEKRGLYKVLPLDLEIEAPYAILGDFLGKLDDLNKSLVRVRNFNIVSNNSNLKLLNAKMVLDMCILE